MLQHLGRKWFTKQNKDPSTYDFGSYLWQVPKISFLSSDNSLPWNFQAPIYSTLTVIFQLDFLFAPLVLWGMQRIWAGAAFLFPFDPEPTASYSHT